MTEKHAKLPRMQRVNLILVGGARRQTRRCGEGAGFTKNVSEKM